jgi:hypothetical protein
MRTSTYDGITSYNYGSQRVLSDTEVDAIETWVTQKGGGIATTSSYFYQAPEVKNVNKILARFNLAYGITDPAGHIEFSLAGNWGGGVDVGKVSSTINMFMSNAPPFGYKKPVTLLQMRAGVPLYTTSNPPSLLLYSLKATFSPVVSAAADYSCPIGNANYSADCSYSNPYCSWMDEKKIGYYVDNIGPAKGRVVAWADEWLTYNTVWNTLNSCGSSVYQPEAYWNNVVTWLGHCP